MIGCMRQCATHFATRFQCLLKWFAKEGGNGSKQNMPGNKMTINQHSFPKAQKKKHDDETTHTKHWTLFFCKWRDSDSHRTHVIQTITIDWFNTQYAIRLIRID